jgi:DNA-binding NtrC family response regulator
MTTDRKENLLIVDDTLANLQLLTTMLRDEGYEVRGAPNGEIALKTVGSFQPALVLLDINMPDIDGYEVCRRLKADPATAGIPVIFLSALSEEQDKVTGFDVGGIDYIPKPFQLEEVRVRIETHLAIKRMETELRQANEELTEEIRQRQALSKKLSMVSKREAERWGVEGFVGQSPSLQKVLQDIKMLEHADSVSVLITGESGTGKELVARAFHTTSSRADGPFIPVNCATIPKDLAESLVFGHKKGAFSGADQDQDGYFDLAHGGTLFLDEIGDMPSDLQTKLLRVLEDGQVMPLGAREAHGVDVRIVSATNVDLDEKIAEGVFREDLFYRVARFTVEVPPLRNRREDIPLLAQHFLQLFATEMRMDTPMLSKDAIQELRSHDYPGNIRELKNVVERGLIESRGGDIQPQHLHLKTAAGDSAGAAVGNAIDALPMNFAEVELGLMERAMRESGGNVAAAARMLDVDRSKLYRRLKDAGRLPDK